MKTRPPRWNITRKFIAYLMFLSVLPLLIIGATSYHISHRALLAEASRYTSALVAGQRDYLDVQLEQIEALIANLSGVEEITDALDDTVSAGDTYADLATQARIGYILNGYSNLRGLVSIDIVTRDGRHYHVGDTLDASAIREDLVAELFVAADNPTGSVYWRGIEHNVNRNSSYRKVVTAAKVLTRTDRQSLQRRPLALLLVNYSAAELHAHFSDIDLGEDAHLMVVDAHQRLLYHPDITLLGARLNEVFMARTTAPGNTFTDMVDGREMFVSHARSRRSGWTVLGVVPLNTLTAQAATIGTATLLTTTFCLVLVCLVAWSYNREVVAPIRMLTGHFKRLQRGALDPDIQLPVRSGDEIGELSHWFNEFMAVMAARRRSEQALRDSEERFSLAVRGANDGIWDWDVHRNRIYFSSRWKQMLGYQDHELGDDPTEWLARLHPDERPLVEAALDGHLRGGSSHFAVEHRLRHRDGEYRWVLARGLAVWDESGNAYRMAGSHTEITELRRVNDQLKHNALHDALTGLPNRVLLLDRLHGAIESHRRFPEHRFAVLFLDLDRFKFINDCLGHNAGDQFLMEIAQRLQAVVRAVDTVARLGGDEFIILLDQLADFHYVSQIARRVLESLATPFVIHGQELATTASIGIALSDIGYEHPEHLLRDADIAMYRAKAQGKARYEFFNAAMRERMLERLALETDLRYALERGEFELHFQPIVSFSTGRVVCLEVLLRWRHPRWGLLPPADFIPLLEESGLITGIGAWVIRSACTQTRAWQKAGFRDLEIAVNLSPRQFLQADLVEAVTVALRDSQLAPECLVLEITESLLMQDVESTIATLRSLDALGVRLAIDDFGTGYSSLSYLKRFPIDQLKIDRSFVRDITTDPDDAAIVEAVIALARSLRLQVVAEGVETAAQHEFLGRSGCDDFQGYYFSTPLPAAELGRLLAGQFTDRNADSRYASL